MDNSFPEAYQPYVRLGMRAEEHLAQAVNDQDGDRIEFALYLASREGPRAALATVLHPLLAMTWHSRHEDIALLLQRLRNPASVEPLRDACLRLHPFLVPDDGLAFIRKCTWALADIGNANAKRALEEIAGGILEQPAAYARKRLDQWDEKGK